MSGGAFFLAGTSHHVAPVALREQLLDKSGERAVEALLDSVRDRIGPAVVISTCNRLEIYCWSDRPSHATTAALWRALESWSGVPRSALRPHVYVRRDVAAARHLVRVAAGLDSLAIGESQVLGQIRAAWTAARRVAPLGTELDGLFRTAIEAARRIRRAGAFDRHPSVAGIAVEAAAAALGGLHGKQAAVLGAGVTGQEVTRALLDAGIEHVTLLNRSRKRAAGLEGVLPTARVTFATLDALDAALRDASVLICATAAPIPIVSAGAVAEAVRARGAGPVIVDIAVPRDVEADVRHLPGVRLIDLDDLGAHCALDSTARREAVERAEAAAAGAAEACAAALRLRDAVPDIVALRRHAAAIRAAELGRMASRLRNLTADERASVEQATHAIVQKLLHGPTLALRATAALPPAKARRARARIVSTLTATDRRTGGSRQPAADATAG